LSDNTQQEKSALFVATLSSFMGPFIISSVNVALPAIQKEFSADAVTLSWVATALLLTVAIFLIPMGKIGDIYGRKKVFAWGLAVYTFASLLGAFSISMPMLITVRILQGFGAAMFVTTGMAIITSIFPPHKRGRAIGIYVAAVYIGLSVGPFAGGFLTQYLGWRSNFAAVVPFGVASVWVTLKYLKGEWADAKGEKFDIAGSLLYAAAVFLLVYGASLIPQMLALYFILTGAVTLLVFIRLELHTLHPVFEVRLFSKNKLFAFSSLAALINYAATFAVTFLLSLYLQYIKGLDPRTAGTVLVAQPVIMAIFSPMAGRLSDRIEPRLISSAGMALTALGLFSFALVGTETRINTIVFILIMLGFGFALFSSPNMSAIMGSVDKKFYGIASGTVATMRLLGQMISMAIAMVVFAVFIGRVEINPSNYELFLKSVKISFVIFTIMCVIGIFFSFTRGELRSVPGKHP
jgi:EmrB/QacA subfamily drug resistance transporter